jgi:transaldolase
MKTFFFDTANIEFIRNTWDSLKPHVSPKLVAGITTNPNAFFKINKHELQEWFEHLPKLCALVSEIRGDNKGVVYVQVPSADMTPEEVIEYAKTVSTLNDGQTKIGLKIPPYKSILEINDELQKYVETNVTGLADCATALKCIPYGVDYISIIPGRMEEVGIDAKAHIDFVNQTKKGNTKIISGSMRTLEQLIWTWQYDTVPTIGERVWPLILEGDILTNLLQNIDYSKIPHKSSFSPLITEDNINLSVNFFKQMNECGVTAAKNWNDRK